MAKKIKYDDDSVDVLFLQQKYLEKLRSLKIKAY